MSVSSDDFDLTGLKLDPVNERLSIRNKEQSEERHPVNRGLLSNMVVTAEGPRTGLVKDRTIEFTVSSKERWEEYKKNREEFEKKRNK